MLPRVIANLRSKFVDEIPNFYHLLITFITEYNEANPKSLSIVQVDAKNCSHRTIVSIPHAKEIFDHNCIPIFFIDGTFHDGLLIQLSVKLCFGGALPLIPAWMPVENKEHFVFSYYL